MADGSRCHQIVENDESRIKTPVLSIRGFAKKTNSKNPGLLWKSSSQSEFFFFGKSSQNSPKPVLTFWSSIPCVFCLYIAKSWWLLRFECSVHVSDGFPKKKSLDGGGWVGGVSSIQVYFGFLEFF